MNVQSTSSSNTSSVSYQNEKSIPTLARWRLIAILLTALGARLWFFGGVLSRVGHEKLVSLTYDVGMYNAAARMISDDLDFTHRAVVIFGPGYPTFLALVGNSFNLDLVFLTLVQLSLSAISSVLLALYTYRLTRDQSIALVAGLLNALSLVAIGLSGILLSGTLYFFLTLSGLYLLELGIATGKMRWFILSGMAIALSLLTRSLGVYFTIVILIVAYLRIDPSLSYLQFFRQMRGPLLGLCIPVIVALGWSTHNQVSYGFFEVAISAPHGLSKAVALVRSDYQEIPFAEAKAQFFAEMETQKEFLEVGYDKALSVYTRKALKREFFIHPFSTFWTLARNAFKNMTVDSGGDYLRIIEQKPWQATYVESPGANYRTLILALLGLILLVAKGKKRLAATLALICLYYSLTSSFALHQGARIFYPAQIAWSILVALTLVETFRLIQMSRKKPSA